jgi:integrase
MQDQNPHIYPFVVIGLETSMRKPEMLSIRREHIDIPRRTIYIPRAKAGAREQPITAYLAGFLQGYLDALQQARHGSFPR